MRHNGNEYEYIFILFYEKKNNIHNRKNKLIKPSDLDNIRVMLDNIL